MDLDNPLYGPDMYLCQKAKYGEVCLTLSLPNKTLNSENKHLDSHNFILKGMLMKLRPSRHNV